MLSLANPNMNIHFSYSAKLCLNSLVAFIMAYFTFLFLLYLDKIVQNFILLVIYQLIHENDCNYDLALSYGLYNNRSKSGLFIDINNAQLKDKSHEIFGRYQKGGCFASCCELIGQSKECTTHYIPQRTLNRINIILYLREFEQ